MLIKHVICLKWEFGTRYFFVNYAFFKPKFTEVNLKYNHEFDPSSYIKILDILPTIFSLCLYVAYTIRLEPMSTVRAQSSASRRILRAYKMMSQQIRARSSANHRIFTCIQNGGVDIGSMPIDKHHDTLFILHQCWNDCLKRGAMKIPMQQNKQQNVNPNFKTFGKKKPESYTGSWKNIDFYQTILTSSYCHLFLM